jgi:hypothetical protein
MSIHQPKLIERGPGDYHSPQAVTPLIRQVVRTNEPPLAAPTVTSLAEGSRVVMWASRPHK